MKNIFFNYYNLVLQRNLSNHQTLTLVLSPQFLKSINKLMCKTNQNACTSFKLSQCYIHNGSLVIITYHVCKMLREQHFYFDHLTIQYPLLLLGFFIFGFYLGFFRFCSYSIKFHFSCTDHFCDIFNMTPKFPIRETEVHQITHREQPTESHQIQQ